MRYSLKMGGSEPWMLLKEEVPEGANSRGGKVERAWRIKEPSAARGGQCGWSKGKGQRGGMRSVKTWGGGGAGGQRGQGLAGHCEEWLLL